MRPREVQLKHPPRPSKPKRAKPVANEPQEEPNAPAGDERPPEGTEAQQPGQTPSGEPAGDGA